MENISRKKFIATTALAAAGLPFGLGALAKISALPAEAKATNPTPVEKIKVSLFFQAPALAKLYRYGRPGNAIRL